MKLLLLLLLLIQDESRAETLYKKITFPDKQETEEWRGKGAEHRKVMSRILSKGAWLKAFRNVEKKIGRFDDGIEFELELKEWEGDVPAKGFRRDGKGVIQFNMRRLAEYQKKIDEFEKKRRELRKQGQKMTWKVPPIKFELLIHHELVHILQNEYVSPGWFHEGIASWVADDQNYLYDYANGENMVDSIEVEPSDGRDNYGRGMLFFKWLERKISWAGVKNIADKTFVERGDWKAAIELETRMSWDKIVETEKKWSARFLERYKRRKEK